MVTEATNQLSLPLAGLRVIDMTDGKGEMCGRYLADLGADVAYIESAKGAGSRQRPPLAGDTSLHFATHNANKRSVVLDLHSAEGRNELLALAAVADILIESSSPGELEKLALSPEVLQQHNPELVLLSITDFGQTGPYKDYVATNAVHMAMAGMLARSGIKGNYPLLPPGEFAYETTAIQAAWVALVAYWQRLNTGSGGYLDFSIFESAAQVLDPGLGVTGSAAGGRGAAQLVPRGRPPVGKGYPIFPCADGFVRICVLNPRQWQGMCGWLGDDHPFTDPIYANMGKRYPHMREINELIAALYSTQKAADLVIEGQKRGVPIAAVATPSQVLSDGHFNARDTFTELEVAPGVKGKVPTGYIEIDGKFCGIRKPAPALGEHTRDVLEEWAAAPAVESSGNKDADKRRPFDGIRVLDLGVIVAGAELGRLFSDQGAEVIKVENHKYADGLRQSLKNEPITESFAQGSRGKQSMGLNLRSEKGKELFKQLVAVSDIVMSNFKPGTMESLGFGYDVLKAINPGIIVADSSALGSTGPMSKSMGYGPLVRASTGLTGLWRYPEDPQSFSDAVTIIPDHFAGRVSAAAIVAMLIRRQQTGEGGTVSLSQSESILAAMSNDFLKESLQPGSFSAQGNRSEYDAPNSVFPCADDDEWCVVAVRNNDDWLRLCQAIDRSDLAADSRYADTPGRLENRDELEQQLSDWTRQKTPYEVTKILQAAGVPAGNMMRLNEYESNPHLKERNFFRTLNQTGLSDPLLTENGPVSVSHLPEPDIRPAPFLAEHTQEVAKRVLGLSDEEIAALVASGDLELLKTT